MGLDKIVNMFYIDDMVDKVKTAFGTHTIAGICQVTRQTVVRWIEEGKLPFFNTGGGQRRVWATDLVAFLKSHNIPAPREILAVTLPPRILIVGDEPQVRRLITRILRKQYPEVEIHEAEDGFEAGHKTTYLLPSLVLLDLRLPGINGVKVCQMIRQQESLKGIKILAMSGHNIEEARKEVLQAGADDFIGKPFETQEMEKKLARLLPAGAVQEAMGGHRP